MGLGWGGLPFRQGEGESDFLHPVDLFCGSRRGHLSFPAPNSTITILLRYFRHVYLRWRWSNRLKPETAGCGGGASNRKVQRKSKNCLTSTGGRRSQGRSMHRLCHTEHDGFSPSTPRTSEVSTTRSPESNSQSEEGDRTVAFAYRLEYTVKRSRTLLNFCVPGKIKMNKNNPFSYVVF